MIRHVVMWKLRGPSEQEKQSQAAQVKAALLGLQGKIPGLQSLDVGLAKQGEGEQSDVVLITTHDDWAALETYQKHPEHQVAARLIGELRVERRVVDFEF
jgi:hypothetical protein